MDYSPARIGVIIHRLRIEHGLSQEVCSGFAGIARSHLSMIETGTKAANVETLARLANTFGLTLSELFKIIETEDPVSPPANTSSFPEK